MRSAYKWGIVVVALVLAAYGLAPTFLDVADGKLDRNVESYDGTAVDWLMEAGSPLTLGLDLQGGLLLQYKVMVDKAVQDKLDQVAQDIKARLTSDNEDLGVEVNHPDEAMYVRIAFQNPGDRDLLDDDIMSYFPNMNEIDEGQGVVRLQMKEDFIQETKKMAMEQAIQTIRDRVNALGVTEPSITRRGQSDIVVQLPGLEEDDMERAKDLIGQTAQLVFRMVDEEATGEEESYQSDAQYFRYIARQNAEQFASKNEQGLHLRNLGGSNYTVTGPDKETLEKFFEDKTDEEHMVGYEYIPSYKDQEKTVLDKQKTHWRSYYLFSETKLTGDMIQDARVSVDQQTGRPVVSLTFNRKGADIFAKLTEANVGKRFAIMLDNEVQSAPNINEAIPGGRAQITMGQLQSYAEIQQEAQDLVIVLRHGALPAPIELQHQTVVGPTLGAQSIRSSSYALLVGTILIIVFMLIYYQGSGVISVTALLLNLMFIMAALAGLGATLTLPGIAGIILTVGMAVDANVIIFERVREEVRAGRSAREAVNAGFDKALSAVIDANVTTGIAALVLMQYGTGPIRGFAVTLLIGIISTIFTAVFIARLLFDTWMDKRADDKKLSI